MTPVAKRIGTVALMTVVACGVARAQYEIDNPDAFIRRMKETFRTPNTPENIEKLIIYCKQKVTGETVRTLIGSNQDRRIEDDFHWCGR